MPVLRSRTDDLVAAAVRQRLSQLVGPNAGEPGGPPVPGSEQLVMRPGSTGVPEDPSDTDGGVRAAVGHPAAETAAGSPPVTSALGGALVGLDPGRRGVRALAAFAVLVVLVAAGATWWLRPKTQPVPTARVELSATAVATSSAAVVVSVAGRVHRPGLVRLPAGARVADAIAAAGGALPDTDLAFVNLARKLVDGELVVIGVTPPPGVVGAPGVTAGGGSAGQPAGPVNLNTATTAELQTLPGVGPVLADRIIAYRTTHGGFGSVDELKKVEGIGASRFEQLRAQVTV